MKAYAQDLGAGILAAPIVVGAVSTFHPNKGKGWIESILALMIVGATVYVAASGQEVHNVLSSGFFLVSGYFFGRHITENAKVKR